VLDKALELNAAGSAGTRSELEERFLALTSNSGLPEPLVNTQVDDIEVDFHWPSLNLVVEVDGPGHTRARTQREDEQRDARLRAAGHTILRVANEMGEFPTGTTQAAASPRTHQRRESAT
jgi:very-short-patch-repair endonuclease